MPRISIVIRTKDEEKWIRSCLDMVRIQEQQDFEIVLVENQSSDRTVEIARRMGVDQIVMTDTYLPGAALNKGIRASTGEFIVCLSAHCIPKDRWWLGCLLNGFADKRIAGVYGRQIPLSFSPDSDKRDLLITFGLDRRVQIRDYFFHNANSALRRDVWESCPFDEEATNIEDRIWAKQVIETGMRILYEPKAAVYHHHGIHHNLNVQRLKSTVSILEDTEPLVNNLPESMKPENVITAAVCPVLQDFNPARMEALITDLNQSNLVDAIVVISELVAVKKYCSEKNIVFVSRPPALMPELATLEDVLKHALSQTESRGIYPELVIYANYDFKSRPSGLFGALIHDVQYKGLDTVFPAVKEYYNLWVKNEKDEFVMIGNWLPRERREPTYRAINGLGTVTRSSFIREGKMIGDQVGLVVLPDYVDKKTPPN